MKRSTKEIDKLVQEDEMKMILIMALVFSPIPIFLVYHAFFIGVY